MTVFSFISLAGIGLFAAWWYGCTALVVARSTKESSEFFCAVVLLVLIVCATVGMCWLTGLQVVKLL